MSGEIISLKKARKAKARAEAEISAGSNRAFYGRTKAQKALDKSERTKVEKTLDGAKREDPKPPRR